MNRGVVLTWILVHALIRVHPRRNVLVEMAKALCPVFVPYEGGAQGARTERQRHVVQNPRARKRHGRYANSQLRDEKAKSHKQAVLEANSFGRESNGGWFAGPHKILNKYFQRVGIIRL